MRHSNNFIKRFIQNEEGQFIAVEWSFMFVVSMVIIFILLPNLVIFGRDIFYTNQIASYGVQLAAENGEMTNAIATEMETQLANVGITNYHLYGPGSLVPFGQPVEVDVETTATLLPLPSFIANLKGMPSSIKITVDKLKVSEVYTR